MNSLEKEAQRMKNIVEYQNKQNEFREDVKKLRKILFDNTDGEILKIKQGDSDLKLRRISFQKEILQRV
jgi:hypothetical protein